MGRKQLLKVAAELAHCLAVRGSLTLPPMRSTRTLGLTMIAVAAASWGFWPFFVRASGLEGPQGGWVVFAVMGVPAVFALPGWQALRNRRATLGLLVSGVCDGLNFTLYFTAVKIGPVSVAVLTHYLAPMFVALLAPLVLKEPRSRRILFAIPVVLAGLALLLGLPGGGSRSLEAAMLGTFSAVFFAGNVLAAKQASSAYSVFAIATLHSLISAIVLLVIFGRAAIPPAFTVGVQWLAGGGLLLGLLAGLLFLAGLRVVPSQTASVLTYLEPLVAAAAAWALYGEKVSALGMLGGALVLGAGIWVILEPPLQPQSYPGAMSTSSRL
jgi:drug/metabolite transporter, DME family